MNPTQDLEEAVSRICLKLFLASKYFDNVCFEAEDEEVKGDCCIYYGSDGDKVIVDSITKEITYGALDI